MKISVMSLPDRTASGIPGQKPAEITWFNDGKAVRTDILDESCRNLEISIPKPNREFGLSLRSSPLCGILVLADPLLTTE